MSMTQNYLNNHSCAIMAVEMHEGQLNQIKSYIRSKIDSLLLEDSETEKMSALDCVHVMGDRLAVVKKEEPVFDSLCYINEALQEGVSEIKTENESLKQRISELEKEKEYLMNQLLVNEHPDDYRHCKDSLQREMDKELKEDKQ